MAIRVKFECEACNEVFESQCEGAILITKMGEDVRILEHDLSYEDELKMLILWAQELARKGPAIETMQDKKPNLEGRNN